MFNIKKTTERGKCWAMRCKGDAANELCPKHLQEWEAGGKPPLESLRAETKSEAGKGELSPEQEQALVLQLDTATKALALAQGFPLNTEDRRLQAAAIISKARESAKAIETNRTSLVKPLNDVVKRINRMHNDVKDAYDAVANTLAKRLGEWKIQAELARSEGLALIAENPTSAPGEAFQAAHASTELAGVREAVVWNYRVIDESRLPDYCFKRVIDHDSIAKICRVAAMAGTTPQIPGCEFTKEIRVGAG